MSRMTAAQVIAIGEYLQPDFDPSSLTVPQLLGVFGYHNVNYPSQYTKPKLVQLFNDEIKPKATKLKKERLKRENSQASDDGIKDGVTGRPINEGTKPVRRSSRRSSRVPSQERPVEPEAAPPKRRRSSAQPSLGGPSRRKTTKLAEPVVVEESEPEEEVVVRKVGRSKKSSTDAGTQARRVSQAFPEDSGWEDNNVFQSGAESSSPARPSPVRPRTRRSSVAPRPTLKSRKSMSAPPQYLSEKGKEPEKPEEPVANVKPPSGKFEPRLPPGVAREARATTSRAKKNTLVPEALTSKRVVTVPDDLKEEEEEQSDEEEKRQMEALRKAIADTQDVPPEVDQEDDAGDEEQEALEEDGMDAQVVAVSKRISEGGQVTRPSRPSGGPSLFIRFLFALVVLASSGVLYEYKHESAEIGFCDTGKATNAILDGYKARSAAIDSCNRENRTTLYSVDSTAFNSPPVSASSPIASGESPQPQEANDLGAQACPPLPLIPLPQPQTCTPCPRHAVCTPSTMTCENGYILHPHPLLYFLPVPGAPSPSSPFSKTLTTFIRPGSLTSPNADVPELIYSAVSFVLDGMPGVGPVALPPRCVEDPRRTLHIGALGRAVRAMLAAERGRRLCEGVAVGEPEGDEVTEAKRWGVELEQLKEKLKEDLRDKPKLLLTLDDTFNEAIQQLVQWGGVFMGEDAGGKRYLAHRTPSMSWHCAAKVKARDAWNEWQRSLVGSAFVMLSILALRRRQAQNVVEKERVASLVQIALDLLRNQELAHHTDPVTAPQPYLSSLQLRDLVLQDEHSVGVRRRLWERVERVVEGNANVRTNLEEVDGGDELRVWRWVGSAGTISPGSGGPRKIASGGENARITA